jgi:DNA-binding CsgD family transcriptional regulator
VLGSLARGNNSKAAVVQDFAMRGLAIRPDEVLDDLGAICDHYNARSSEHATTIAIRRRHMQFLRQSRHVKVRKPLRAVVLLDYWAEGKDDQQIADVLGRDVPFVRRINNNVYDYYGVQSKAACVRRAYEWGERMPEKNSETRLFALPKLFSPEEMSSVEKGELFDHSQGLTGGQSTRILKKLHSANTPEATTKAIILRLIEPKRPVTPVDTLSVREAEILSYAARGCNRQKIANILTVSLNTIQTQMAHIHEKLGTRGQADSCSVAFGIGLFVVGRHIDTEGSGDSG